jgi:hypothetical protein
MASLASGGNAERIAARILCRVLRAGSETAARYSSTLRGAALPSLTDLLFAFALRMTFSPLASRCFNSGPQIEGSDACTPRDFSADGYNV